LGNLADSASTAANFLGENVVGVWTIIRPIITSADFGGFDYGSNDFSMIKLSVDYNNFKYEKSAV
jgi:hypothetical protein